MIRNSKRNQSFRIHCTMALLALLISACSSDNNETADVSAMEEQSTVADENTGDTANPTDTATDNGMTTDMENSDAVATATVRLSCEEIATQFVTRGSANPDLAEPEISASCADDTVTVIANGIPDFPYIATSPGVPTANVVEYIFPATPSVAQQTTAIPIVGEIAVAINGVPIYGPTEGPGGDVNSRPGGFTECGGHNGPTGYHYHLFDVTGTDYCLFSESDIAQGPVLFGYALDGYPIYSGNTQYRSSWFLSDASLFATDTWSAHTYAEGSGDLDQCNGREDDDGNYAYYTTDDFPYVMGCFRGEVTLNAPGGGRTGPQQ